MTDDKRESRGTTGGPESALVRLEALHREIDLRAGEVAAAHGERIRCGRACTACCRDEITVFTVEAERIRRKHADLLAVEEPYPEGACAFLSPEGLCRVYEERPYVCRTQGLPLRWLERAPEDVVIERRDICPLNDETGPPLEELPADQCWPIGPVESRLIELEEEFGGGELRRIALRDLFERQAGSDQSSVSKS